MNIYVGNLPYQITEEDLRTAFEAYGQVTSINIIKDKMTGESRGFAFVEMADGTQGQSAIQELNGKEIKGRALKVNEARPRTEGGGGGGGGGGPRRGGPRRGGGGGGGRW